MEMKTPQQEKRIKRLSKIIDEGGLALLEYMIELEEMIESTNEKLKEVKEGLNPEIEKLLKKIKGDDGYTPVKGIDYDDGEDGDDGLDYVLTENDKTEIASKIKVPIVEKVVVEKTETIVKEKPIVTEIKTETKIENPVTGKDIVDKVNDLEIEPELQIDFTHIKGWEDKVKSLIPKTQGSPVYIGGGNSGGGRIVKSYDISSQLDGVTKTFNLPAMHRVISVHATSFPGAFRETIDYTFTSTSITFTSEINAGTTLAIGQTVVVVYSEA